MQGGDTRLAEARRRLRQYVSGWQAPDPDACWPIEVGLTTQGYTRIMVDRELDLGHRWAYRVWKGPIPEGQVVRHTCDNPPCVNPDHLLLGSQSQNIQDCVDRGRHPRNKGGAKLTAEQREEIRTSSETAIALAERFGVHRMTIGDVRRGKTWGGE